MMYDAIAVIVHAIPAELKEYAHWVGWKTITRGGKQTKVPINPDMGSFAQVDAPSTWGTFDQARERYRRDRLAGVGFVFSPMDLGTGIDLDKCRNPDTGEIEEWAQLIIDALNSYAEISPSGTGVHVIVKAHLPGNRNRVGRIEMYDTLRFLTITGHRVPHTPAEINDRQAQLDQLYRRLFGEAQPSIEPDVAAADANLPGDALWQWAYPRLSARMRQAASGDDSEYSGDASSGDGGLVCALLRLGLTRAEAAAAFRSSPRGAALAARKGAGRLDYLIECAVASAAAFVGEGVVL